MENIKPGDCVQLKTGTAPQMAVSSIDAAKETATCFWFDEKQRKTITETLPLIALKKYVAPKPVKRRFTTFSKGL